MQVIVFKFPLENVKHVNGECGDGAMHFSFHGVSMARIHHGKHGVCVCVCI